MISIKETKLSHVYDELMTWRPPRCLYRHVEETKYSYQVGASDAKKTLSQEEALITTA